MMSRQTDRPRPVPPRPEASGAVLVEKKGSKMRLRFSGAMPTPWSVTLSSVSRPPGSAASLRRTVPPSRHRLAGVDQEVDQDLLDLRRVDLREGPAHELDLEPDLVPRQVLADEEDDLLHQAVEVDRLAMVRVPSRARQAEHAAGDCRGPLARLEDAGECPLAVGRVRIAKAELGVVEDRGQGVVQFVENPAGEDPQAADPLQRNDLASQGLDLFAPPYFSFRRHRHRPRRAVEVCGVGEM
jgi:hypothetical protein